MPGSAYSIKVSEATAGGISFPDTNLIVNPIADNLIDTYSSCSDESSSYPSSFTSNFTDVKTEQMKNKVKIDRILPSDGEEEKDENIHKTETSFFKYIRRKGKQLKNTAHTPKLPRKIRDREQITTNL